MSLPLLLRKPPAQNPARDTRSNTFPNYSAPRRNTLLVGPKLLDFLAIFAVYLLAVRLGKAGSLR